MEIWDAYDEQGHLTGGELVRGQPVPPGLYHLVADILVRHRDGDYLLMQRDPNKKGYGGWYEASAGGSALKGETAPDCAKRELSEETGIQDFTLTQICHCIHPGVIYVGFLAVTDCDKSSIVLQKGETVDYKWLTEQEFIAFVNSEHMIPAQKQRQLEYYIQLGYIKP
jgi:8-oxo-dGTP pyrophosphatase MutT (NUDIX family)